MIYLDYNATSPYSEKVQLFIKEEMTSKWFNPSSEYSEGSLLADEIKSLRSKIAEYLGCSTKGIIFTSGATESINTVLSVSNLRSLGIKKLVSSHLEHHATLDRLKFLKGEGFDISFVSNDQEGQLNLQEIEKYASTSDKTLFSFLFVNNEIGTINPVKEISKLVHKNDHLIHVDAVQALGKLKFNLEDLDIDFASFSGHKIGAFKGIGILYSSQIKELVPLLHGGGQERGYRPGTLNFSAIKSLGLALEDAQEWDIVEITNLRNKIEKLLMQDLDIKINCQKVNRICNTINFSVKGKNAREILAQMSREGIFISTGSACSSGSFEPSHVIRALGYDREYANTCIRLSISNTTKESDIMEFLQVFKTLH